MCKACQCFHWSVACHSVCVCRPMIQEMASRIWVNYAENERKGTYTMTERIPPQIKVQARTLSLKIAYIVLSCLIYFFLKKYEGKHKFSQTFNFNSWQNVQ